MEELAAARPTGRHVVDRVSSPVCLGRNRHRFELMNNGERIRSAEVVCGIGRLSEREAEISDPLTRYKAAT
jgi:hypothetical protein